MAHVQPVPLVCTLQRFRQRFLDGAASTSASQVTCQLQHGLNAWHCFILCHHREPPRVPVAEWHRMSDMTRRAREDGAASGCATATKLHVSQPRVARDDIGPPIHHTPLNHPFLPFFPPSSPPLLFYHSASTFFFVEIKYLL